MLYPAGYIFCCVGPMQSLRGTAVAKVVVTLSKYGELHLSDLCRKSEVAYAHLYRVLPTILEDGIAETYMRKNRKYYRLTDKGRALASALGGPEELAIIFGEKTRLRGLSEHLPLPSTANIDEVKRSLIVTGIASDGNLVELRGRVPKRLLEKLLQTKRLEREE